ncbi:MAG: S8 family serine peptidase [Xanthobacteraceae bacterium]|nr:S8 family serine peptidase [Xanthobacteraceae bacterium]
MRSFLKGLNYLLLASALCVNTASFGQSDRRDLTIKIGKLTPALVATIARVGEERSVDAPAATDIIKLIADHCGSANARRDYLPLFLAANASNAEIRAGKTVLETAATLKIPACIYANDQPVAVTADIYGIGWDRPRQISPGNLTSLTQLSQRWAPTGTSVEALWSGRKEKRLVGQSIDAIRITHMAATDLPANLKDQGVNLIYDVDSKRLADPAVKAAYDNLVSKVFTNENSISSLTAGTVGGPNTLAFERAVRTQDVLAANESIDPNRLKTGSALISSDFVPGQYTFKLRADADPKTAAQQVLAALSPRDPAGGTAITSRYEPIIEPPGTDPGCKEHPSTEWPINVDELQRVLKLRTKEHHQPVIGQVLILDTGFPPGEVSKLPFWPDLFVRKVGHVADAGNEPFLWTSTQPPDPPTYYLPGYKNSGHGIGVLTTALGGPEVLRRKLLQSNVVSQNGAVISLMGYKGDPNSSELDVDGRAVVPSISGSGWGRALVSGVNLSLRFSMDFIGMEHDSFIKARPSVLYVFAAGNDNKDIEQYGFLPASWGGERNPNAITVGAVDFDGNYWPGSNWSVKLVDIAAAGCAVPTLTYDEQAKAFKEITVSGTSFAAPLVSFTGSMLRDLGDPTRIKARILSSGRYVPQLAKKVRSARVLDVPVALSLQFDAIRDASGHLRLGRIAWPAAGRSVCDRVIRKEEFSQISITDPTASQVSVVLRDKNNNWQVMKFLPECPLQAAQLSQIEFQEIDEQADDFALKDPEMIDIRNIRSITFCELCKW